MSKGSTASIGFFQKYLSIWVALCIAAGVAIGYFIPGIPALLGRFEYAHVSIPVAILIWLMIYPMMLKVDFASIKNAGRKPKGLIITLVVNWFIKPFTMYFLAWLFLKVVFKALIPESIATEYIAGAVLLGAAPCTAMVFVWSYLSDGDAGYTVVQVAVNDLVILVVFAPIVAFLLKVGKVTVPMDTLFLSVVLFVVIPLGLGAITRSSLIKRRGKDWFDNVFYEEIRRNHRGGTPVDARDPVFFPGKNHPEESVGDRPYRRAAGNPELSYLCHRVLVGVDLEGA